MCFISTCFHFRMFPFPHVFLFPYVLICECVHFHMFSGVRETPVRAGAEIAVDAAQCRGTSTRAVNGQVRQCNSMCLLRCSCEHAEMRRYVVVRQQRTIVIRSRSTHGRSQRGGYIKILFHKKMHITNLRPFFSKKALTALTKQFSSNLKYLPNMFVDWTSVRAKPPFKRIDAMKT